MKTLLLTTILVSASAYAEMKTYSCRADDYYCQSKSSALKQDTKISKAKSLSDKVVPMKEKPATRIEAMSESKGQGIYSGIVE